MEKLVQFFKHNSNSVLRLAVIVFTIGFITYLFPREGKFSLEYSKGEPWKHNILIAPYNFPIMKSLSDIKDDRDSLMTNFRPYFRFDSLRAKEQAELLAREFKLMGVNSRFFNQYRDSIITQATSLLNKYYQRGVILLPEEYANASRAFELMVVRGSYAEPYGISELLTPKETYTLLSEELVNRFASKYRRDRVEQMVQSLDLNRFIVPNIRYDKERTELEMNSILKNLSLSSGGVLAGQRIIDKGEIITEHSFRVLDSFKKEYEARMGLSSGASSILLGQILIVSLFVIAVALFLFYFRYDIFQQLAAVTFIFLIISLMIVMASLSKKLYFIPSYVVPFALLPIILRTFFDSRLAFFVHVNTIILASFFAESSFEFLFLHLPIGVTVILTLFKMTRRSQLMRASFFVFITYALLYTGLSLIQEGSFLKIETSIYGLFAINALLLTMIYPLIYTFEKLFGFLSDITLVELSDTNHPLLRELSEKAPGTFQHSIQVGNLAQEAAYKIGANSLLVRAGAMYHDIGKTVSPGIFTENQMSNFNPLTEVDLKLAAKLVIQHIENGVQIAKKHKIPQQIIDFIVTHQGTGKTKFFYNSYVNDNPDMVVDSTLFMYPGPIPFSRETAILMMADSVEAASRSLKNYSPAAIDELVERIVAAQIADNQFVNAPITFKELSIIKEVFKSKLQNIYHSRIEYPALKGA